MITNQSTAVPIFANKTKLYLVPTIDTEFGDEWSHPKFSLNSPVSQSFQILMNGVRVLLLRLLKFGQAEEVLCN